MQRGCLVRRTVVIGLALVCIAVLGIALVWQRQQQCAYVPVFGEELLPNATLAPAVVPGMPTGWSSLAPGVEVQSDGRGFNLSGRSLQLLGIANAVVTPAIAVNPGQQYCFVGRALTDSEKQSATRLQVAFDWRNADGTTLYTNSSPWQPVALWTPTQQNQWAYLRAASTAPADATSLVINIRPSSDDRVYLDAMHVRRTWGQENSPASSPQPPGSSPTLMPWPNGAQAAVAFTFDWETAMGGLIHTRSNAADDPNFAQDWQLRAMRMREGVTTTLDLFRPYGIRATYYATGYNFLNGNTERRQFMGNPTYAWASRANGWPADWSQRPWFGQDPYGTVQQQPIWYFGDLVATLQAAKQDIQSHTFAHFAGTFVRSTDWQADFAAWRAAAAERGVAPARSLAFPWSASNGVSDDEWNTLAQNGITSVTRLAWSQRKSALFPKDTHGIPLDPRCRPIPGHETILGCPDFYLRDGSAATAKQAIDRALAAGGMIDLWAHTEEVTDSSQIVTWAEVVRYAAVQRDAGKLWIAPLSEIADWQQGRAAVSIQGSGGIGQGSGDGEASANSLALQRRIMQFSVANNGEHDLYGVTLKLPVASVWATVDGVRVPIQNAKLSIQNLSAKQTVEVVIWPA